MPQIRRPPEAGRRHGLARAGRAGCRDLGHRIVLVLGEPADHRRYWCLGQTRGVSGLCPSSPALLALELMPGALNGVDGELRHRALPRVLRALSRPR